MDPGVPECVEAFLRRYPRYYEPPTAASQCRIATSDLVDGLLAGGHFARVVWVRNFRAPFPDPQPRALDASEHALARLETGDFIDVTRRQYDPCADVPTYYESEEAVSADWQEINDDEDRNAPWRMLAQG